MFGSHAARMKLDGFLEDPVRLIPTGIGITSGNIMYSCKILNHPESNGVEIALYALMLPLLGAATGYFASLLLRQMIDFFSLMTDVHQSEQKSQLRL